MTDPKTIPADAVAAAYVDLTVAIVALDERIKTMLDTVDDVLKIMVETNRETSQMIREMLALYEYQQTGRPAARRPTPQ